MLTDGKLTQANVHTLIMHALYNISEAPADGSSPPDAVRVDGIVFDYGFNPERLADTREDLLAMFAEIDPRYFNENGFSFLFLGFDKDEKEWTSTSMTEGTAHGFKYVESFLCLALAQGLAKYTFPRALWRLLPGGAPFVELSRTTFPVTLEA